MSNSKRKLESQETNLSVFLREYAKSLITSSNGKIQEWALEEAIYAAAEHVLNGGLPYDFSISWTSDPTKPKPIK